MNTSQISHLAQKLGLVRDERTTSRNPELGKKFGLANDERGLSTVEYVILLALIAMLGIGVWTTLGKSVKEAVEGSNKKMDKVVEAAEAE